MGACINEDGYFQSDKYPDLKPHQVLLDMRDPAAQLALEAYAVHCEDREFAADLYEGISAVKHNGLEKQPD